jgi:hypothetical protein
VKSPASLTESGFVPPELNVKENEAPPLANEPEPKGLVRVKTLLVTEHPAVLLTTPDVKDNVHDPGASVIPEGKVI